jgi:hypothetical protein
MIFEKRRWGDRPRQGWTGTFILLACFVALGVIGMVWG